MITPGEVFIGIIFLMFIYGSIYYFGRRSGAKIIKGIQKDIKNDDDFINKLN